MIIGYRRMSGAIGLTTEEQGTRGLWWEKRLALTNALISRGHQVGWANRMTKASASMVTAQGPFDLLMIEFGSSNSQFYGKDLEETRRLIDSSRCPVIFLCDDPDLPFLWKTVERKDYGRWTCWYNSRHPQPFGGQPKEIRCMDMPFSSLQGYIMPAHVYQSDRLVYIGRPKGREKVIAGLICVNAPFKVFAKQKEWDDFGMKASEPPQQPLRAAFYNAQIGALALGDQKHKRLAWRTGRAFHAVLGGCPTLVEYDHPGLRGFPRFLQPGDVASYLRSWKDPIVREQHWMGQLAIVQGDRQIAEQTFKAAGL